MSTEIDISDPRNSKEVPPNALAITEAQQSLSSTEIGVHNYRRNSNSRSPNVVSRRRPAENMFPIVNRKPRLDDRIPLSE